MMRRSILIAVLLATATSASARQFISTDRKTIEMPMFIAGNFRLENPDGDIDVVGTDDTVASVYYLKTITGVDEIARDEGAKMALVQITGDERQRIVRTWISPVRRFNWTANFNYVVRLPRTANVTIVSGSSTRIRVADMRGGLRVQNFSGGILLERVMGPTRVDSANGNIVFQTPPQIAADVRLTSVNGSVEVHTSPAATFRWIAEANRGETKTTLPVSGTFAGTKFSGYLNARGSATLVTNSLMGNVALLRNGSTLSEAQLVREMVPQSAAPPTRFIVVPTLPTRPGPFRQQLINGPFEYATTLGDVAIAEIRGDANILTGAGSVQIGAVTGQLQVESRGGPLTLGQILGPLTARTAAGDVIVQSAREGSSITTGGGIIRLLRSIGAARLESGGGDIVVNASGPVSAETRSGDITVTLDRAAKSQRVIARTAKGNVLLHVGPGFGADIDATVVTTDANANTIRSEFGGLSVQRDQIVGGRTRIRATGKINGGGERVELFAENGGIQITTQR
jgi:DUF4097 and DUF4098 domain-containing protein YvlB